MINYKRCTINDSDAMFAAFTKGFSDYIIKFDIDKERFLKLFLHIEGNSYDDSWIALDDNIPVGIMLGGIKDYESVKTLRCGTLAVDPNYRKKGIAQELYNRHLQIGIEKGCKQLFLEVIKGNDSAIHFYKKQGYEIKHDIFYYQLKDLKNIDVHSSNDFIIKKITFADAKSFYINNDSSHINWQNDFDYQKHVNNITYFGAYQNDVLIGVTGINQTGKIYFISVLEGFELYEIGMQLLSYAMHTLSLGAFSMSLATNDKVIQFLETTGFVLQTLSQHEMYLNI